MKKLGYVFLLFVFTFVVLPVPESSAQQKVITLRYSNFFDALNQQGVMAEQWSREVEKRTDGRVKITYYPGGTLTPATQTYDSVIKGIADIGFSLCSFTKGRFPLTEVIDLPLGYRSAYQSNRLVNEFYVKFTPKEFDETKVMFLQTTPPLQLFTKNKPVNKLEDLKGLKIRGTGNSVRLLQLLGAAPVGLPITEAYDALSKGVVDGIHTAYDAIKPYKLAELVRYCTEFYSTNVSAAFVVMNKQKWESLSPDVQKIIEGINEEWIEKQAKLWEQTDNDGKDVFLQKGEKLSSSPKRRTPAGQRRFHQSSMSM